MNNTLKLQCSDEETKVIIEFLQENEGKLTLREIMREIYRLFDIKLKHSEINNLVKSLGLNKYKYKGTKKPHKRIQMKYLRKFRDKYKLEFDYGLDLRK